MPVHHHHHPPGLHVPALDHAYTIARAVRGAARWHVAYCTAHGRHIVAMTTPAGAPCCHVTPTRPGFAYAARLADALNRAHGIDPLEGFDVVPVLGSLEAPSTGRAQPTARKAAR